MPSLLFTRPITALGIALFLGGCATQAQQQFQAMATGDKEANAQLEICATSVYESSEYASIRPHVPRHSADATLQQLSDPSFATPSEIQAIFLTHPKQQDCRKAFLAGLTKSEPSLVPIFAAYYAKGEDDLLLLVQHKLAWGDDVRRWRDRWIETQAALQTAHKQIVAGLNQEHQAEMAQRQRAADALGAMLETEQLINAASRPVVTNCNSYGNSVSCVSR